MPMATALKRSVTLEMLADGRNLQVSKVQNDDQIEPLFLLHLERPDDRNGEGGKKNVNKYVERCVDDAERDKQVNVVALGMNSGIPMTGNGHAMDKERNHAQN